MPQFRFVLLVLLAGAASCRATPTAEGSRTGAVGCCATAAADPTLLHQLQTELDSLRQEYGFPGATAACTLPDGTVIAAATGLADVEAAVPMAPASRMLAASIGKTFVGATAVALARQGVVDLDAPLSTWLGQLPWFARLPDGPTITLRHVLTHSSGLDNHVHLEAFQEAFRQHWAAPNPLSPAALVAFILDRPLHFAPGTGWAYSDTGYLLAGMAIEQATGEPYYDTVARLFLEPLGLTHTAPSDRCDMPGLATGYMAPDNPFGLPARTTVRPGVMAWNPGVEWTGGGLVSTAGDLAQWAHYLYGGSAMPGPYLETLLQAVALGADAPGTRYGLGVAIHESGPWGPTYGHGGWIPGYTSSLRYYPQHRVAVAFQVNTDIGIVDGGSDLVADMEAGLARVALTTR